jgi:ATP-binding cassette subfamily B protein
VLFQEPVRYAATVNENVEPDRGPDAAWPTDPVVVERAVRASAAEAIVARLPHGYETLLGRWFETGTELSGGEWQRLALARALARETPILCMDEPTSAMDSWAEGEWFDRLRQAAAGRTTLIITHRFTTAMQADVIHVMQGGRIVESGTHEDLIALGGRYAESWARQTRERTTGVLA